MQWSSPAIITGRDPDILFDIDVGPLISRVPLLLVDMLVFFVAVFVFIVRW